MSVQPEALHQVRQALEIRRNELRERRHRVNVDLARGREPLLADADDRAIQLENDEPLQAIGGAATEEIAAIDAALERLSLGLYGICKQCGERISPARLHAVPHAVTCTECTDD